MRAGSGAVGWLCCFPGAKAMEEMSVTHTPSLSFVPAQIPCHSLSTGIEKDWIWCPKWTVASGKGFHPRERKQEHSKDQ